MVGHRNIGPSTGFMAGAYGDWEALTLQAAAVSTVAAELSALSEPELPGLVEYLSQQPPLPFLYLSVHAPSKARAMPEDELVDLLANLPPRVEAIVVHPDVMVIPAAYARLGRRLVVENMDRRKPLGQTAEDLDKYFDALPEAGLCFDVPHAASVDASLAVGHAILDAHRHRLRHVHLSSLDNACHHVTLTREDRARFEPLLNRCRDVPWILEARPA